MVQNNECIKITKRIELNQQQASSKIKLDRQQANLKQKVNNPSSTKSNIHKQTTSIIQSSQLPQQNELQCTDKYMQSSMTNINHNLTFTFLNVQTRLYSTKLSHPDAAIYAESIEYLKRQYFIINEIGIQEIFQRIGMLAGFYSSAVLLRFQYPMMIVTRTKQIFLKRLKRYKKMLTQQGSSDQSKTNTLSRSIQLHTNTFLDSVNSSQLSKRTAQLRDQLFPQFRQKRTQDKSYDTSVHDIHNPLPSFDNSIVQKRQSILEDESFADKLMKLSKNISLNQMIDSQAVQVNLSPLQTDVSSLICDFDQVDRELTMQNYQKIKKREKQNFNYHQQRFNEDDYYGERFKKKSKMFMNSTQQNGQYLNHQKTLQNPKSRRLPKQMQFSAMQRQLKSRQTNSQQTHIHPKMSAFYQTKNSLMLNTEEQKFGQHEESYKTLERFRTSNNNHQNPKSNQHDLKHIYNNNREGYGGRTKANSYQEHCLPRHRSNNVFNINRQNVDFNDYDHILQKPKEYHPYVQQTDLPKRRQQQHQNANHHNPRFVNPQSTNHQPYSMKNKQVHIDEKYVTEFDLLDQNQRIKSPRFANELSTEEEKFSIYSKHSSKMQMNGKMTHLPVATEKYYASGFMNGNPHNRYRQADDMYLATFQQEIPPSFHQEQNLEQKLEKKKKIRQKAAQLLSRVKSQQYFTTRNQMPYVKRY